MKTKKLLKKSVIIPLVLIICCMALMQTASAYYNQGVVTLTLGTDSINVSAGTSVSVSATVSPASQDQTPGCGMAACPQQCPPDCQDKNGQCVCAGVDYSTYYASVTVQTSNGAVATANHANGVVSIRGVSQGTATITLTASLRQWTNSAPKSIRVNVTAPSSSQSSSGTGDSSNSQPQVVTPSSGSSSSAPSSSSSSAPSSTLSSSSKSSTSTGMSTSSASSSSPGSSSSESSSSASSSTVIGSMGTYEITEIPSGLTGLDKLGGIQGTDKHLTFEKKDAAGNVLYSWTFKGSDVNSPADVNFNIAFPTPKGSKVAAATGLDEMILLSFAHHGDLPGKAQVSVRVSDTYKDGTSLRLYFYDDGQKKARQISSGLKVENGYATFEITHCSQYFLTTKAIGGTTQGLPAGAIAAIVLSSAAVLSGAMAFLILRMRKSKRKTKTGYMEETL